MEKLKKYVQTHELKIEDCEQAHDSCAPQDRKEKKALAAQLKKLQGDAKFEQAKKDVIEIEAELRRLALHDKPKTPTASKCVVKFAPASRKAAVAENIEEIMTMLDATLAAGAKDKDAARDLRASALNFPVADLLKLSIGQKIDEGLANKDPTTKVGSMRAMKALSFLTPVVVLRLEALMKNFGTKDSKHATDAFIAVVKEAPPQSLPSIVLPPVLAMVGDKKKWKVQAAAIEVLATVIERMATVPRQLASVLHDIIPACIAAAKEIRKEIKNAATAVLQSIGQSVGNPEIRAVSESIVQALIDPSNQKYSQEVLMKLGSTTFMNYVDANGLAILVPILIRALREREQKSRKWAAQILGSCIKLVADIDFIFPYLDEIMPLLKNALIDETPEVQREAAKAFGYFGHGLHELWKTELKPYLENLRESKNETDRYGAALAMSYVYFNYGKDELGPLLEQTYRGVLSSKQELRHTCFEILDILPALFKEDFAIHIEKTMYFILTGSCDDFDKAREASVRAASSMIGYFGPMVPQLMFPMLQDAYFQAEMIEDRLQVVKHANFLCDKILENKKYGQDILTTECGPEETRKQVAAFSFMVWKGDSDGELIRASNWKAINGGARILTAILDTFASLFAAMKKDGRDSFKAAISKVAQALDDAKVCTPADLDALIEKAEPVVLFREMTGKVRQKKQNSKGELVSAEPTPEPSECGTEEESHNVHTLVKHAGECLNRGLAKLGKPMAEAQAKYVEAVVACCLVEILKKHQFATKVAELLKDVFPELASNEALLLEIFTDMHPHIPEDELDDGGEELIRVDGLMLMYGGGHLLLKDTTLRICQGRKYGIVGHNGCGKTTLMKQLAEGNVSGMPKGLKVQHVSDAELGDMKVLEMEARAFIARDAPKGIDVEQVLEDVNFPRDMQDKIVSDLSGGWRMRLILARAMMKNADLLLLDEPTNHLDVQAIDWLEKYLAKSPASMMIISHEASFINKVCTDVMQYTNRKLKFHHGNLEDFEKNLDLKGNTFAAYLRGDVNLDEPEEEDEDEAEAAMKLATGNVTKQKLTFPIPGKLTGVSSSSKPVMSMKDIWFAYDQSKGNILEGVEARLSLNSRVAIVGRNGAGKSTMMGLLCRELNPCESPETGKVGEVYRHHNLRLAYIAQHHMETIGSFFQTTPYAYMQYRFQNGWDEVLQKHLLDPRDEEEEQMRKDLAKKHGKYGLQIEKVIGRSQQGKVIKYEVQWEGLETKQNTFESILRFREMGVEKFAIACDERLQAQAAGNDQRALSRREVVKHLEQFGIDEEMCCNRNIGSFSAGQKSKLALGSPKYLDSSFIQIDGIEIKINVVKFKIVCFHNFVLTFS